MIKNYKNKTSPSQQRLLKPATGAGFGFLNLIGDKMGTRLDYKTAKIYKGKKWFVFFSYKDPGTKRFRRYKVYLGINSIKDKEEKTEFAIALRDAINELLKAGKNPHNTIQLVAIKTWSLIQAINYYKQKLTERGLRQRTIETYKSVVTLLTKATREWHNEPLSSFTKLNGIAVLNFLKREHKWSNTTYNNNLTFFRAIWGWFNENEFCKENPFRLIKPLKSSITRNIPFTDNQLKQIKENCTDEFRKFLMFMYHTGTRPAEAARMEYEFIERKLLLVPGSISKNGKDCYVPISEDFIKSIGTGKGRIFKTNEQKYQKEFSILKAKLKLPKDVTLYSIKHTRAVHLAEAGASPYAIMQLFRHHSLDQTMSYLKNLGITIHREAAEKGIKF